MTRTLQGFLLLGCLGFFACSNNSSNPPGGGNPTDTTHKVDTTTHTPTVDSVVYSFAVMGCNRLDAGDVSGSNPSTANLAQLDRTLTDVMNLNPRLNYLFLVGDLILGKTTDTSVTGSELRGWLEHYRLSALASLGITLVLVPGNHEFNDGTSSEVLEKQWVRTMAPNIVGSNGPSAGGADNLPTDQSRLSYSFNFNDAHFVVLNSDPAEVGSSVPVKWVAQDLAAARSAGAKHLFLFDHKPAYDWTNDGATSLTTANRDALWATMTTNHAEALFSAHNHVYRRLHPSGAPWMVIAGNGGSPLESTLGADRNFGFTTVSVMKSGKVIEKAYARDYGTNYNDPSPVSQYPTTLRDSADISWKN